MSVVKIFMERDGMTKKEAVAYCREIRNEIIAILEDGGGYEEVEDLMLSEGLEMDYIMEFI